jgi:hypothetical protein
MKLLITAVTFLFFGSVIGYFVRQIVARFQKRSLETNVKELMLRAREDATRITEEADRKSEHRLLEVRQIEREHEIEFKKNKDFLVKKESLLDNRQIEIDAHYDDLKKKIEEVRLLRGSRYHRGSS